MSQYLLPKTITQLLQLFHILLLLTDLLPSDIGAAFLIFKIPYYSVTIRFFPTYTIKSTATIAHDMEQEVKKRCQAHEPSINDM